MKEVIDIFKPSIKKHPLKWCAVLLLAFFLYHFIPPIATAAGNRVTCLLFDDHPAKTPKKH